MPNADRAAVAREVLTPVLAELAEWPDAYAFVEKYMQRHYPAPPAPETVTVTFRDGSTETLSLRDGKWQSGTGLLYDELIERACLDRIASDARVLQERDARIAELENELRRALDGAVFHEKRAHHAEQERDAALRALEELKSRENSVCAFSVDEELAKASQGEGLGKINEAEQAHAEEPSLATVDAAPAPIPLGADEKPFDQTMDAKLWAQEDVRRVEAWIQAGNAPDLPEHSIAGLVNARYGAIVRWEDEETTVATGDSLEALGRALAQEAGDG